MKALRTIFVLLVAVSLLVSCAPAAPTAAPATEPPANVEPTKAEPLPTIAPEVVPTTVPAPTEPVAAEAKYKDTLLYATAVDQNWMDGQMNNTNDKVLRTVYSSLVKRNGNNEIVPDLAESWEVAEDGVTWTFKIRQDVKFHNGKPLTTADIKASYDRLMNKEKPVRYTATVAYLKEVNVVDDYTIQFVTNNKYPIMLASMTHRAQLILDKDFIEKFGEQLGTTAETVNGTGPFKLAKWDVGEQQVFERFDDYFLGPAVSKTIVIKIVPDASARAAALETGEVDIADGINQADQEHLKTVEGIAVNYYRYIGMHGLQFNCADPYLKDVRLRLAVSYAVDREAIVNALYNIPAGEDAASAPVHPLVNGYYDFGAIKQDQEKAKALMAEAGVPDGFPITIQISTSYSKALETGEMMVEQLAEVGIKATLAPVDNAAFNASFGSRKAPGDNFPWSMFFMGFGPSSVDAGELARTFVTSPDGNNNNNYGWYSNPKFDELIKAAATEMDKDKRNGLLKDAMQVIYLDDPVAVYTNNRVLNYCMKDTVVGFEVNVNNAIAWHELGILDK